MELISIKEYSKREKISDTAVRKRVSSRLVKSVMIDGLTYIIDENEKLKNTIKNLRYKNTIQREQIKALKADPLQNQKAYIEKLEAKIEKLEAKIEEQHREEKSLYEKVIQQYDRILIAPINR